METLYCYRYNEETGEINKYEINEYRTVVNQYTGNKKYVFRKRLGTKTLDTTHLYEKQLNKYLRNKVFMFEDNETVATQIIEKELKRKKKEAEDKVKKAEDKLYIFWTRNLKKGDK